VRRRRRQRRLTVASELSPTTLGRPTAAPSPDLPPPEKMKIHRNLHSQPRKEEHRRREERAYLSRNRYRERKRGEKWGKNRCHLYLYRQAEPVQPSNRSEPAWTPLGPTARLLPFPGPIPLLFCPCTPWLLLHPLLAAIFISFARFLVLLR